MRKDRTEFPLDRQLRRRPMLARIRPHALTTEVQGLDRVQELQHIGRNDRLWATVYQGLSTSLQFADVIGGGRFEVARKEPVV